MKKMNLITMWVMVCMNVYLYMINIEKSIEIELIHSSFSLIISFIFDKYSLIFLYTVLFIFISVMKYTNFYMEMEVNKLRFKIMLWLFVSSMILMIIGGDLFTSFIAWDCLGVTSFLLIMFYSSFKSLEASILVYLMNRLGDCFYVVSIVITVMISHKVGYIDKNLFLYLSGFMIFFTSLTKSAQIPFSSWLPAAMEAPTPVSALVHSSTLVTAGLYLMFRYQNLWDDSCMILNSLTILSACTLFLASTMAMVETDMKKIIALSTLSQLGFIMFTFSMKLMEVGFFHMIMHAYFKALLFMVAGVIIHSSSSNQSIFKLSTSSLNSPSLVILYYGSILSMSGMPFLSGFYSKDLILDSIMSKSYFMFPFILIFLSLLMTVIYCVRVLWFLLFNKLIWNSMSEDNQMFMSTMWMTYLMSCISGSMLSWLMFPLNFYIDNSKFLIISCLLSTVLCLWALKFSFMKTSFLKSMWFLNNLIKMGFILMFNLIKSYNKSGDMFSFPGFYHLQIINKLSNMSVNVNKQIMFFIALFDMIIMIIVIIMVMMNNW